MTGCFPFDQKKIASVASETCVSLELKLVPVQVFARLKNHFSDFLHLGPFPADDEPVSDKLIKACAAVEGTDLNDICLFFDINDDDLQDIREKSSGIVDRRFRVLSLWKKRAEAPAPPTVRVLLGLLRQMNIGQLIVEKKYQALFGRK